MIETRPVFFPLNTLPPYKNKKVENYEVSNYASKYGINLPSYYNMSENDVNKIIKNVKLFFKKNNLK